MEEKKRREIDRRAAFYTILTLVVSTLLASPIASLVLIKVPIPFIQKAAFKYIMEYTSIGDADIFYSGLVDFSVNLVRNSMVCRHINVRDAIKKAKNTTIYLIIDGSHLRAYVNGEIIDHVAPEVIMNRETLRILECNITKEDIFYSADCKTIYYAPYVDEDHEDKVYSILSALDYYENRHK